MTKSFLISIIIAVFPFYNSIAQDNKTKSSISAETEEVTNLRDEALNVFLDCRWCDRNYIRQTIPFVNYVNNKDEADVHILVRRRITGGGGGEYTIDFIGQDKFSDIMEEMMFFSPIDETADETRRARSNVLAMGLMKFVARTPLSRNIRISYEDNNDKTDKRRLEGNIENDPWDSWMFKLNASGSFSKDENYESSEASTSLATDRVTPDLKMEYDAGYSYNQTIYTSNSSRSFRERWSMRGLIVRSLSPNLSIGGRAGISSDTYNNYNLATNFGPAIEYNVYPYEESFKRQFRIQYGINGHYNNYNDTTTFFKTDEFLLRHYISAAVGMNQPWGFGYASLTWANYLHDFAENNLGVRANLQYRIYKGLSLRLSSRANLIHDQRNLVKGDATEQEVLTRQRALKTSYSYSFGMGLTYSFGSIYNNVVNPRFGN